VAKGRVKWFNRSKGYGFVEPEDGTSDIFVHITAVQNANLVTLFQGQIISYDLQSVDENRTAVSNIVLLEDVSDVVKSGEAFGDTLIPTAP